MLLHSVKDQIDQHIMVWGQPTIYHGSFEPIPGGEVIICKFCIHPTLDCLVHIGTSIPFIVIRVTVALHEVSEDLVEPVQDIIHFCVFASKSAGFIQFRTCMALSFLAQLAHFSVTTLPSWGGLPLQCSLCLGQPNLLGSEGQLECQPSHVSSG